jgi:hypothetical protein
VKNGNRPKEVYMAKFQVAVYWSGRPTTDEFVEHARRLIGFQILDNYVEHPDFDVLTPSVKGAVYHAEDFYDAVAFIESTREFLFSLWQEHPEMEGGYFVDHFNTTRSYRAALSFAVAIQEAIKLAKKLPVCAEAARLRSYLQVVYASPNWPAEVPDLRRSSSAKGKPKR